MYMCVGVYDLLAVIGNIQHSFFSFIVYLFQAKVYSINIIPFIINVISAMCTRNLCVSEAYYMSKSKSQWQLVVRRHLKTTNAHAILNYTGFRISY